MPGGGLLLVKSRKFRHSQPFMCDWKLSLGRGVWLLAVVVWMAVPGAGWAQLAGDASPSVPVRVIDRATGFDVDGVKLVSEEAGGERLRIESAGQGKRWFRGRAGRHEAGVSAAGYRPLSGLVDIGGAESRPVVFRVEPVVPPPELDPARIASLWRPEATVFLGFVGDEESGTALGGVRVFSLPSGVETRTDGRGFFQLPVPLQSAADAAADPARLVFEKPGYRAHERRHLELSGNGDWIYRVRLARGGGRAVMDERETRRWSSHPRPPRVEPVAPAPRDEATPEPAALFVPAATHPTNFTIRVPRTIRVLYTNVVFYESMEGYCKHSLPSEWIASWGAYTGGSNSLQAGAVAVRTYAIGFVNQPSAASYDICATTSCQVYNPSVSNTRTDAAVNLTAGYVMVNSAVAIPRGLTEYSSENNQLGMPCGDGFTAPSGGCISDPVCSGEPEFGHGRGMCQWGSVKWATGLKFPGNSTANTTLTNGQPRRDWIWILQHYYPNLTLLRGTPLVVGDDVRVSGIVTTITVRNCAGNTITNGVNCPSLGTVPSGGLGVIIGGPLQVTNDASGYTWWQVQWSNGLTGWSVENYLERVIPVPSAPVGLVATAVSSSRVNLSWSDTSELESGFTVEQALAAGGPWAEIDSLSSNVTAYAVSNLTAETTWYFRVRAFNLGGSSAYSSVASATTPGLPPMLTPIPNQSITEGLTLSFTASASAPEFLQPVTDFEGFANGTASGTVMLRAPNFSGSTSAFLEASPNIASVTSSFPSGNNSTRALRVSWSFTNAANPWLRLTTASAANLPSPVVDFTRRLRFDLHTDRALRVALGLRETTNAPGTPIGSNGGGTGGLEWAGVTNSIGGQPQPTRTVAPGAWTMLTFDLPTEPVRSFSGGNGVLSTASGLGSLEHLAFVPADGIGIYNVHLDNFVVAQPKQLTYTLGPGAPANAAIHAATGVFTWTTTEAQGPFTNVITVIVTDNSTPPLSASQAVTVVVLESNLPPVLTAVSNRAIHAGTTLVVTNVASDPDLPANLLTFSLVNFPAGAAIGAANGRLTWPTTDADAGTTNSFSVRVTDNGVPARTDTKSFSVRVATRPRVGLDANAGTVTLTWEGLAGVRYAIEFKDDLGALAWQSLTTTTALADGTLSVVEQPAAAQGFYRIRMVD